MYFDEVRGGIEITYGPQAGGILRIGAIDIQVSAPAPAGGYNFYAITLVPEPRRRLWLCLAPWRLCCGNAGNGQAPPAAAS
jgi:hypothetical protein